jgi:hypothetical protein
MRTITRGVVPVVALAVLVAMSVPSSALKPEREVHLDEGIFTLDGLPCDGFTVEEETLSERVTFTTYVDGAGDPVKVVAHANFFGILRNPVTGTELRDHSVFTETENVVDGTVTVSGPSFHYIQQGSGQVFAEVGHKITMGFGGPVLFQSGKDDFVITGEDGICELLA